MSAPALASEPVPDPFRHEALFYDGEQGFLDATVPFIKGALDAGEPTLVVVSARKIGLLQGRLGPATDGVRFEDMAAVGVNPARIIPVWREFVDSHPGRRLRGIGEPVWPERTAPELVECHRHEALLNVAFAGGQAWWLLCPYDTAVLDPAVVDEAQRTHPFLMRGEEQLASGNYAGLESATGPFSASLPEPDDDPPTLVFGPGPLESIRAFVEEQARAAGLVEHRVHDLVLAVNELATNSLRYGGGSGRVRLWRDNGLVLCEVRDSGHVTDPLAGRREPGVGQEGGRGLWLANQLCDLVQLRTSPGGTVVRLHVHAR